MRFKDKRLLKYLVFGGFVAGLLVIMMNHTTAQDAVLFIPVETPLESSEWFSRGPQVLRTRYVRPDFNALNQLDPQSGVRLPGLNLFVDVYHSGLLHQVESSPSGGVIWMGTLEGVPWSTFTLVQKEDVLVGTVKLPGASYRITYVQEGIHAILEMDEGVFPPELEPIPVQVKPELDDQPLLTSDDGSLIDVLVVYTEAARLSQGGSTVAIEALIDTAIAETNTSYTNSGVSQQLQLVHTEEVVYSEAGFNWGTTIERLKNPSDGYMDGVHALRDNTCADAVVLLVNDADYCGLGYMMDPVSPGFESSAFSVVSTSCATGYYSFGHELGHNMGARHDWYVDDTNTYAHGFVNFPDRWRTIMAYDADCTDRGGFCTRLQYWSNPSVSYGGDPMGVADGTSRACVEGAHDPACDADNHLMLNSSALTVANFRDSAVCNTYNITGHVRDSSDVGIAGVSVDFDEARPAVITNGDGYYEQSGFSEGSYSLHFSKNGYMFSPRDPLVTVGGSDAVQDVAGYPAAGLPYSDGFESGALGSSWIELTAGDGRVRVDTPVPHQGSYSLLLDDSTSGGGNSQASASLFLDLGSHPEVDLSFWWREFGDEDHPEDGVFISDDYGVTWSQVFSFNGSTAVFTHTIVDLDAASVSAGMSLNDHFLVKFQFFDNDPIPQDGYAIDDVWLSPPVGPVVYQAHTVNDNTIGDSFGDDDGIAECGEIVELFVDLTNQGTITATQITATLSTVDPHITFLFNTSSAYPDIPGGGNESNANDYDFAISPDVTDGHIIPFVLTITALNGGPWIDGFDLTVGCSKTYLPLLNK
jgi:hypothetical protein